ncbi:MAG: hypothetical protein U1E06_20285 [Tabrizicola sp.]|nr:hypothetical protein [Tabrizicola sp.]MDP3263410.1 hypothetical protein [Tabrizicola sp.]MDP3646767.1 hypothetical protein [Paracoccaceae bacterium]MDZ4069141.1 hypothetical protein [Tabrizicola sp.]
MNRQDFNAWEHPGHARADPLWETAGRPEGGRDRYLDQARDLVAIEAVDIPTLDPEQAAEPQIEEASLQRNLGEFPTLVDQGEERTYPDHPPGLTDDGKIRLSDGDASETGGVLPDEDLPEQDLPDEDLPEAALADADITSSAPGADDGPENDNPNDDGMPDPTDLDAEAEMEATDRYEDAAVDQDEDDPSPWATWSRTVPAKRCASAETRSLRVTIPTMRPARQPPPAPPLPRRLPSTATARPPASQAWHAASPLHDIRRRLPLPSAPHQPRKAPVRARPRPPPCGIRSICKITPASTPPARTTGIQGNSCVRNSPATSIRPASGATATGASHTPCGTTSATGTATIADRVVPATADEGCTNALFGTA